MPCAAGTDGAPVTAMGHVILSDEESSCATGSVLRRLRAAVHRSAVPGQAARQGDVMRRVGARQEPHRRRSRRRTWTTPRSNRCCSTGRPTPSRCRRARWDSVTATTVWASGTWTRPPGTGFDRRGARRQHPRWFICRASTRSTGTARRWHGVCRCAAGRRAPGVHRVRPDARPGPGGPGRGCPGPGPPGTTTPPSRTPRPGRSRSPGSPPRRPSASPGNSPATPWSPAAVR